MDATNDPALVSETERNKEIVLNFYLAKDHAAQKDLLAADMIGRAPGVPPFGRDGFLRGIAELEAAFPDGTYTNDEIVAEGDKVVTVGRFRGTHLNPFHGQAPTGKPVTFVAVHVDRVAGGKIVEHLRVSVPEAPVAEAGPRKGSA